MLAELARKTIESLVKKNETVETDSFLESDSEFLKKKGAAFVTLKKNGDLRACIGTYLPTQDNVAQEVVHNAVGAAVRDYRFGPVEEKELPLLSYEVQVLSEPEPVGKEDLDPDKYGIVIKEASSEEVKLDQNVKTAVLLPDLEGIDSAEKQISIACRKAGIVNEDQVKIWRFTTENYVYS